MMLKNNYVFHRKINEPSQLILKQMSFLCATLDIGGWLNLTERELSSRKKRQASLVALTLKVTGAAMRCPVHWFVRLPYM